MCREEREVCEKGQCLTTWANLPQLCLHLGRLLWSGLEENSSYQKEEVLAGQGSSAHNYVRNPSELVKSGLKHLGWTMDHHQGCYESLPFLYHCQRPSRSTQSKRQHHGLSKSIPKQPNFADHGIDCECMLVRCSNVEILNMLSKKDQLAFNVPREFDRFWTRTTCLNSSWESNPWP